MLYSIYGGTGIRLTGGWFKTSARRQNKNNSKTSTISLASPCGRGELVTVITLLHTNNTLPLALGILPASVGQRNHKLSARGSLNEGIMETIIQIDESATGFESLRWVAKAVAGKSDRREQLQCIKVEPKRIIGTDGHRLHLDNVKTDLKPGLYQVVKSLVKSLQLKREDEDLLSGRYPHIDSVLSEDYEFGKVTLSQDYQSQLEKNLALIIRAMPDNTINPDYLADLLPMDCAHVPNDPLKPITFVNGTRQAIIMPIKMTS